MTHEEQQLALVDANIEIEAKKQELKLAHEANLDLRERIFKLETRINNLIKNDTNLLNSITKDNVNYTALERGLKQLTEIIKP